MGMPELFTIIDNLFLPHDLLKRRFIGNTYHLSIGDLYLGILEAKISKDGTLSIVIPSLNRKTKDKLLVGITIDTFPLSDIISSIISSLEEEMLSSLRSKRDTWSFCETLMIGINTDQPTSYEMDITDIKKITEYILQQFDESLSLSHSIFGGHRAHIIYRNNTIITIDIHLYSIEFRIFGIPQTYKTNNFKLEMIQVIFDIYHTFRDRLRIITNQYQDTLEKCIHLLNDLNEEKGKEV
jgi:6-pyruvoyl-tetrahydropterin synthase